MQSILVYSGNILPHLLDLKRMQTPLSPSCPLLTRVAPASQRVLTQTLSRPLIAALYLFSRSLTRSVPAMQMEQEPSLTSLISSHG